MTTFLKRFIHTYKTSKWRTHIPVIDYRAKKIFNDFLIISIGQ